jgi:hypothetical protein
MSTFDDLFPDSPDATSAGTLEWLRLSEQPAVVVLFTDTIGTTWTHFIDTLSLRAEIRCNAGREEKCLLCDCRLKRTLRAVLPVFDAECSQVRVLLISDNRNPGALGPQIKAELRKGGLDARFLMITRKGNKFSVTSVPAKEGSDMGEDTIAAFLPALQSGAIVLEQTLPTYTNIELWDIPELERRALALGRDRSEYLPSRSPGQ